MGDPGTQTQRARITHRQVHGIDDRVGSVLGRGPGEKWNVNQVRVRIDNRFAEVVVPDRAGHRGEVDGLTTNRGAGVGVATVRGTAELDVVAPSVVDDHVDLTQAGVCRVPLPVVTRNETPEGVGGRLEGLAPITALIDGEVGEREAGERQVVVGTLAWQAAGSYVAVAPSQRSAGKLVEKSEIVVRQAGAVQRVQDARSTMDSLPWGRPRAR